MPRSPVLLVAALLAAANLPAGGHRASADKGTIVHADSNPWEEVNTGLTNLDVYTLAIGSSTTIFAGTAGGAFRSVDGGASWEGINTGLPDAPVSSLVTSPAGTVFAGTHGGGVYRSHDNGDSWEAANTGINGLIVGAIEVAGDGSLIAAAFLGGTYRSDNEGDTWTEVLNAGLDNPFVPSVAVVDDSTVFAGTDSGVYRSTDNGRTWEASSTGLSYPYVESIAASRKGAVFVGTDSGVFRSLDEGASWESVSDTQLENTVIRELAVNVENALFAGTHGAGVLRSLNHGASWETVNTGLAVMDVGALAIDSTATMFAGTVGGGVYRRDASTDVSNQLEPDVPEDFALDTLFPNPSRTTVRVRYRLPQQAAVNVAVYDAAGRSVVVLVDGNQPPGVREIAFDVAPWASGVYFVRLQAGAFTAVRRLVVLR